MLMILSACDLFFIFHARSQPPGLSGAVTFTAALPEKFGKVTWGCRPSGFLVLVLGLRYRWFPRTRTKDKKRAAVYLLALCATRRLLPSSLPPSQRLDRR